MATARAASNGTFGGRTTRSTFTRNSPTRDKVSGRQQARANKIAKGPKATSAGTSGAGGLKAGGTSINGAGGRRALTAGDWGKGRGAKGGGKGGHGYGSGGAGAG